MCVYMNVHVCNTCMCKRVCMYDCVCESKTYPLVLEEDGRRKEHATQEGASQRKENH